MEEVQFKRAELEDKEIISKYLRHHTSRSCERTFVNVFLWSRQYPVKWAVIEGALVFKSEDEEHVSYAFPAGDDESVKKALEFMKSYSEERGYPFTMYISRRIILRSLKNGIRADLKLNMSAIMQIMYMRRKSSPHCQERSFTESAIILISLKQSMMGAGAMRP